MQISHVIIYLIVCIRISSYVQRMTKNYKLLWKNEEKWPGSREKDEDEFRRKHPELFGEDEIIMIDIDDED